MRADLLTLLRALIASNAWRGIGLICGALVLVIIAVAVGQVRLNTWQGAFFDAVSHRELDAFLAQILVFLVIVFVLLLLVVSQTWLGEMLKVRLRAWLTADLLDRWLAPARPYGLGLAGEIGRNPDQRVDADAQIFTELTGILGVGLLQSSCLLVSFIGVLWVLSENVTFRAGGAAVHVPGYMVWCALIYAGSGSILAWIVGRPLVHINTTLYAREGELRFGMVRVTDSAEGIALYRGETDERAKLQSMLSAVVGVMVDRVWKLARVTWVTSGYGWIAIVVPVLIAAPGYFAGDLSFGALMMVVGAFNQVQQSLRWFADNISQIANWRATLIRVMALRNTLETMERRTGAGFITIVRNDRPALELRSVTIRMHQREARLAEGDLMLNPGESVIVQGKPGEGKTALFRAIAGIWPWGTGEIRLPNEGGMLFLPNRPYLPTGTLRESVLYPGPASGIGDDDIRTALEKAGLPHLLDQLDRLARWDRELALDEQQRLAVVRVLLHRPMWLLMDDACSALGAATRRAMFVGLREALPNTALLAFDREESQDGPFHRVFHMEVVPVADTSPAPSERAVADQQPFETSRLVYSTQ